MKHHFIVTLLLISSLSLVFACNTGEGNPIDKSYEQLSMDEMVQVFRNGDKMDDFFPEGADTQFYRDRANDSKYAPKPSNAIGIFVSEQIGDDNNPGTMESPVKTIGTGVQLAEQTQKVVFVAQGTYPEEIITDVSLFGGYRATDWSRNIDAYVTYIPSPDATCLTLIGAAGSEPQILDGFYVRGGFLKKYGYTQFYQSPGVTVTGGNSVIAGCRIIGGRMLNLGMGNNVESVGLFYTQEVTQAVVYGSLIAGGYVLAPASMAISTGVRVNSADGKVQLIGNKISTSIMVSGNLDYLTTGVFVKAGDVKLFDNSITTSAHLIPAINDTTGVYCDEQGTLTAINNQLVILRNKRAYGFKIKGTGTIIGNTISIKGYRSVDGVFIGHLPVTLINNIFHFGMVGTSTGIRNPYDSPIILVNNNLHPTLSFPNYFYSGQSTIISNLDQLNQCQWPGCVEATGNINVNAAFVSSSDLHLTTDSPCIDMGTDPSPWYDGNEIYFDIDGDQRPAGASWDIGMDEYVP